MNVLDLFSGIGGFALGMERAGHSVVGFCEIDPFCRRVLRKHWPGVPIAYDITRFDGIPADIITGGFPCQDISHAGKQAGIDGERAGLWGDMCRIIGNVRPRFVIVENVSTLISGDRGRWFGRVLGDLAALGMAAEWHCISAAHIGANHRRDRLWVVAYPDAQGEPDVPFFSRALSRFMADPNGNGCHSEREDEGDVEGQARGAIGSLGERLRGLGNAIVPQMSEMLGRCLPQ